MHHKQRAERVKVDVQNQVVVHEHGDQAKEKSSWQEEASVQVNWALIVLKLVIKGYELFLEVNVIKHVIVIFNMIIWE